MQGIDPTGKFDIPIGSPGVRGGGIANGVNLTDTTLVTPPTGRSDRMIGVVSGRTVHSADLGRCDAEEPGREASTAKDEASDAARAAPRAPAAA